MSPGGRPDGQDKTEAVGLEERRCGWQTYWEGRLDRTSDSLGRESKERMEHTHGFGGNPCDCRESGTMSPARGGLSQPKMIPDPEPQIIRWNSGMIPRGSPVVRSKVLEPEGPEFKF